ncbi:hypothetical protein BUALT_Bualt11G0015300 [Buddleja alternifolia]|uniref:Uncharacterized protein n=1 Tax=Buddleja alternifolia TaxID=168488 RepID=A0AAV6X093_9LAMI|nr:hypothetical protein BUALT_Bualt11G0015300 [Buddleja alternifolia]
MSPYGGLKDGDLFRSLAKKPAFSFDNLLAKVEKYVNMEEATMMKRAESLPPNKDGKAAKFVLEDPEPKICVLKSVDTLNSSC